MPLISWEDSELRSMAGRIVSLHGVFVPVGESQVQLESSLIDCSRGPASRKQQVEAQQDPAQLQSFWRVRATCNWIWSLLQALKLRLIWPSKPPTRQHLRFRCKMQMEGDAWKHENEENGNWSDEQLKNALGAIDGGWRVLAASREFGMSVTTLRNHLFGNHHWKQEGKECSQSLRKRRLWGLWRRWQVFGILCHWLDFGSRWWRLLKNSPHRGRDVCQDGVGWDGSIFTFLITHFVLHMNWGWEELEAYVPRTWHLYTITSRRCIESTSTLHLKYGMRMNPARKWGAMTELLCLPHVVWCKYTSQPPMSTSWWKVGSMQWVSAFPTYLQGRTI